MLVQQIERIGIGSLSIVILTGTFTGMVFALQSYIGFSRLGGQQFIGTVVALGMARELGPVLTGLMVTGRSCSAIAAEIGTMRITEQLDALWTLRINIFSYLIVPRIVATILMLPCLTLFAVFCGVLGGGALVTYVLHQSPTLYIASIVQYAQLGDLLSGLIKATFFGFILGWVGCYKGYYTHDGARGVGRATTEAVVLSSILILIANYFLTKLLDGL
jgi:phospholipid/cholesterol/gamma-HCH transport system permease protein